MYLCFNLEMFTKFKLWWNFVVRLLMKCNNIRNYKKSVCVELATTLFIKRHLYVKNWPHCFTGQCLSLECVEHPHIFMHTVTIDFCEISKTIIEKSTLYFKCVGCHSITIMRTDTFLVSIYIISTRYYFHTYVCLYQLLFI